MMTEEKLLKLILFCLLLNQLIYFFRLDTQLITLMKTTTKYMLITEKRISDETEEESTKKKLFHCFVNCHIFGVVNIFEA
jgi:hypothetical protein